SASIRPDVSGPRLSTCGTRKASERNLCFTRLNQSRVARLFSPNLGELGSSNRCILYRIELAADPLQHEVPRHEVVQPVKADDEVGHSVAIGVALDDGLRAGVDVV